MQILTLGACLYHGQSQNARLNDCVCIVLPCAPQNPPLLKASVKGMYEAHTAQHQHNKTAAVAATGASLTDARSVTKQNQAMSNAAAVAAAGSVIDDNVQHEYRSDTISVT